MKKTMLKIGASLAVAAILIMPLSVKANECTSGCFKTLQSQQAQCPGSASPLQCEGAAGINYATCLLGCAF